PRQWPRSHRAGVYWGGTQRWAATKLPVANVQCQQRGLGTLEATTMSLEGDNPSMTLADVQQQRLLERLREAGERAAGRFCRASRRRD
ncbi:MAG: hypothetical protein ACYC91_18720, partial [Solirubrobacteraceae bacterium]